MSKKSKIGNQTGLGREGFLLQTQPDRYLFAQGPFSRAEKPLTGSGGVRGAGQASLFYPPFFLSRAKGKNWYIPKVVKSFSKEELLQFFEQAGACGGVGTSASFGASAPVTDTACAGVEDSVGAGAHESAPVRDTARAGVGDMSRWRWQAPEFSEFKKVFLTAQREIERGRLQKVVPVFFETADYILKSGDILTLLYRLIARAGQGREQGQGTGGRTTKCEGDTEGACNDSTGRQDFLRRATKGGGGAEGAGTVYAFWSGARAVMGVSPECLFRKKDDYVQTMALAGTGRGPGHNLLTDPKEQREHSLVVEEIKTQLAGWGNYRASGVYVYSVGNLKHLRTDFKLRLKKDISFERLCRLLHPTPALGGVPRSNALALLTRWAKQARAKASGRATVGGAKGGGVPRHPLPIGTLSHSEKETTKQAGLPDPRRGFGAPMGVVTKEEAFCVVAIRNIQFINGKAYIGSGCGLVEGSQIKREWAELKKKRKFIKDLLF